MLGAESDRPVGMTASTAQSASPRIGGTPEVARASSQVSPPVRAMKSGRPRGLGISGMSSTSPLAPGSVGATVSASSCNSRSAWGSNRRPPREDIGVKTLTFGTAPTLPIFRARPSQFNLLRSATGLRSALTQSSRKPDTRAPPPQKDMLRALARRSPRRARTPATGRDWPAADGPIAASKRAVRRRRPDKHIARSGEERSACGR